MSGEPARRSPAAAAPAPGLVGRGAIAAAAAVARRRDVGLRGKLWGAYVVQIAAISLATLLSVYGAFVILRDVLIQRALVEEAAYYWKRAELDRSTPLPDTYNMQSWLRPPGAVADPASLPKALSGLEPGYHALNVQGREDDDLVYVSDGVTGRLYLIFNQLQVDRLALWFGFLPLTVVLMVIYIVTWLTYRVSKHAVSPVIWLASAVRQWDPKKPDYRALEPEALPGDVDVDVRALASALHGFAHRIESFVERERNFTRDASHELRSPLTVIRVAADVLLADGELSTFGERSVRRILRAARDMEALIEAFLILAREGDVGLPEEDFVVNAVVAEEFEKAQSLVADRPVQLKLVEEAQFTLRAPSRALAVIVGNLLRNACNYTEQGTVTVVVAKDAVRIEDTGIGMSSEELDQVFTAFYRAGRSGQGGHGVGLTIVKRLSERFGWPVSLQSELGRGTVATIRFPQVHPA